MDNKIMQNKKIVLPDMISSDPQNPHKSSGIHTAVLPSTPGKMEGEKPVRLACAAQQQTTGKTLTQTWKNQDQQLRLSGFSTAVCTNTHTHTF